MELVLASGKQVNAVTVYRALRNLPGSQMLFPFESLLGKAGIGGPHSVEHYLRRMARASFWPETENERAERRW